MLDSLSVMLSYTNYLNKYGEKWMTPNCCCDTVKVRAHSFFSLRLNIICLIVAFKALTLFNGT